MKEPILSREEVEVIAKAVVPSFAEWTASCEAFAKAIEAAVMERVCGEPVGFVTNVGGYWHMEPTVDWEKIGLSTCLYTLKDRQS